MERAQLQTGYQILAATTTNLLNEAEADLWNSGKVQSDQSLHIEYRGRDLKPSQDVFWTVRVWAANGTPSAWAPAQRWTMGLFGPAGQTAGQDDPPLGWKARWICAPATSEALLLRKEIRAKPGIKRAIIHVSGLGHYELNLNGRKVGDELLSPGWTDYNDTILYDTRDITPLLRPGTNALGITLGNGMYHVQRRNRFAKFTGSFGPLRAIAQLEIEYADGTHETFATDPTWRTHPGPITYSSIFGGEDYDARLIPAGWDKPGFDDRGWTPSVHVVRPGGKLRGHSASVEPIREIEVRRPIGETKLAPSKIVYDLGQNTSYMPRIRVSGPAGSTVRLIPAEVVNPDGSILRSTMGSTNRGLSWWQYTKSTDDPEEWFPQFYYVGCRYLEATLTAPTAASSLPQIESLEGVVIHADAAATGEFECSNPLLNRIRDLVRWAQRANMVSVLTDCPHREKLGWLEQYHLNGPAIRYEFDMARMFTKGMNDMADAQLENGLVPNIAPEFTEFKGAFRSAAEWGSAFIIVPWQQYQFCGDVHLLRTHYADMKRYFAYLESLATNNILAQGLGDWFDLGPKKSGAPQHTPPPVTATAFLFHDAELLAKIATLLGNAEDAAHFRKRAGEIRASYNSTFFNTENSTYATGSQCANALPLVFGIAEPPSHDAVLNALIGDLEARDHLMTAGDIGYRFLLQALAKADRSDVVYRMINQDDKPGYGYMLKKGETSLTEAWDANLTTSHNHFMLGHITEWFYKDLAGIDCDPSGPGFKKIIIRPQPVGGMTWARARYNSIRGPIESHWTRKDGRFALKVEIPPNTTARVFIPATAINSVTEGGRPLNAAARQEGSRVVCEIGSGRYEFQVNAP
ncbi:MAG TPA: family 78 glycoside hydrolase catalytic domain [Verrucomicrobiae bacterium]|nr:family 78 glycoside hydrolase catalytic domain [Verrucomicrobiae bacterium]